MTNHGNNLSLTRRHSWRARTLGLFFAAVTTAFAGCGSDEAADVKACTLGDTRECLGPGQCKGAQACAPDGKSFLPCDCGAGGAGGVGGTSGSGATTSGGTSGLGGVAGNAASGGLGAQAGNSAGTSGAGAAAGESGSDGSAGSGGGSINDAGSDGSTPGPTDDPCPTQPMLLNCSTHCGGPDVMCSAVECVKPAWDKVLYVSASKLPVVVRTPANPGEKTPCNCSDGTMYALGVQIELSGYSTMQTLEVKAKLPWRVWLTDALGPSAYGPCHLDKAQYSCVYDMSPPGVVVFYVTTQDPLAPATNVTLSEVPLYGCQ